MKSSLAAADVFEIPMGADRVRFITSTDSAERADSGVRLMKLAKINPKRRFSWKSAASKLRPLKRIRIVFICKWQSWRRPWYLGAFQFLEIPSIYLSSGGMLSSTGNNWRDRRRKWILNMKDTPAALSGFILSSGSSTVSNNRVVERWSAR